jgi:hypothetical protein
LGVDRVSIGQFRKLLGGFANEGHAFDDSALNGYRTVLLLLDPIAQHFSRCDGAFFFGDRNTATASHGITHVEPHFGEGPLSKPAPHNAVANTALAKVPADLDVLLWANRTDIHNDARPHVLEVSL